MLDVFYAGIESFFGWNQILTTSFGGVFRYRSGSASRGRPPAGSDHSDTRGFLHGPGGRYGTFDRNFLWAAPAAAPSRRFY